MYPQPNSIFEKLHAGATVHGLYAQMNSAEVVEIAAAAGFDYVIIDCEHGSFSIEGAVQMIRAADAMGMPALVRVSRQEPGEIRKALEAGAAGVVVPDIRTAEQARRAVSAARYLEPGNGGTRGACPGTRATRHQVQDWPHYVRWANANVLVMLIVESEEAIVNLDAILQVEGVDALAFGRFDLAHEMGWGGNRDDPRLDAMYDAFAQRAHAAGVRFVREIRSTDPDRVEREKKLWVERGASMFNMGSDRRLISRVFREVLAPVHK